MRAPISFVYGNCVFADALDDAWAAFAVTVSSYGWLGEDAKHARFVSLIGALEAAEADVQIIRVGRRWELGSYAQEMTGEGESGHGSQGHPRARRGYVEEHLRRLGDVGGTEVEMFLLVSLRDPERDVASYVSRVAQQHPRAWWDTIRGALAMRDGRLLKASDLERVRVAADRAHARVADFLPVRPARTVELQWLVRRAFCRGLGEPLVDGLHEPRALVFERNGEAVLAPLEGDVMRWMDGYVEQGSRVLRIESELGCSWQAQLVVGALPEQVHFPGARAELMFAPPESLPFAIDLSLNGRYLPNELALRVARKRIQDADQIVRAESDGDQGVSDLGYERTQEARDLLAYLQASSRPPLLRATLAIAIGASSEEELEERVEMCRRAYGEIHLHRPLGDQMQLFIQQLPAQRTRVSGYDDTLTTEQVAAMMPTATHAVGSRKGFYLGYTLSGSRQPVRFNLREGSDSNRNTTILSVGALGSGKTTLDQKLKYEGFLLGARVIDCDPKGDHRFHLLEEVAPHTECVTLRPDPSLRGVLDPLRVAPEHLRQEVAVSFLRDLLPGRADPTWETAIVAAVDRVMTLAREPTCLEVVRALEAGDETEAQVGRILAVYARSGLTQLGFADTAVRLPPVGQSQVTYLPIRDLPGPEPGMRRSEYTQAERVGEQLVRLIAMFAMHLMGSERERLKLFSFDEGWRLLGDPAGRALLGSLQRMGRSELAVPIISTQLITDALIGERESLENLIGATFVFGMRSEAEAARALALLGLDPDDTQMRRYLLELEAGRCLLRDHRGRIEAIQVDVVVPSLLRAFSTTPRHRVTAGVVARRGLLASLAGLCAALAPPAASAAAATAHSSRQANAEGVHQSAGAQDHRAPSQPPLRTGGEASEEGGAGEESGSSAPQAEADPLVSNGLGSPLCKGALGAGELPTTSRRNCETSGFVAAAAPTADYGVDVHIETGVLGLNLDTITQDLIVEPLWMALVWAVHALVVMLEWAFTIDLLDSSAAGGVGSGLRAMQTTITDPWLASVLAVASVIALYNGLIRRRVAESVGQAMLALAMMVAGTWVILDPTGTVGALGGWANRAGVGTLGVTASGSPAAAGRTLAESMSSVFATAVEVPWCYLEFGNVSWCRERSQLDPRLRAAALKLATAELALVGCSSTRALSNGLYGGPELECVAPGSAQARAIERSAQLLRGAQTNAAIFLALPANGSARNSITDGSSLLRALCQSTEATSCRGPTAPQAEFREGGGTWSRLGGLFLIAAGALGMLLLFGFVAMRLLGAAIFSLLYLLLAPAVVLAPALGEGGRELFRRWAARLLGAVVAKLLYSFLLGVLLAILAILAGLQALGWWTQWLLMSAFWWGAFTHRHQALGIAGGAGGRDQRSAPRSIVQRAKGLAGSSAAVWRGTRKARTAIAELGAGAENSQARAQVGLQQAGKRAGEQAARSLESEHRELSARTGPQAQARVSEKRAQLERVRSARGEALATGDGRRASELAHREQRVEAEIAQEQQAINDARRASEDGERARRATGRVYTRAQGDARERFLDAQAALPAGQGAAGAAASGQRDYPALAGLAGYGSDEYRRLAPRAQRAARLEVDRELAMRSRLREAADDLAVDAPKPLGWRRQRRAERAFDDALAERMRESGETMPSSPRRSSGVDSWRESGRAGSGESSVMRDAREVAARRKRQLGRDRR